MDEAEILKSAALEQQHWWYAGRRDLVRRLMRGVDPGRALDVGAGSGGNADTLRHMGWDTTTLEFSPVAAQLLAGRGLKVARGDARKLPFRDASFDLVLSTDVWEHVAEDRTVAQECFRVVRPGGRALIAVPASMSLWSGHDEVLGHFRRYERAGLVGVIEEAGFKVHDIMSWNVLLMPVARLRRSKNAGESDLERLPTVLNAALRAVLALEAQLPVQALPGLSLVVRAYRP